MTGPEHYLQAEKILSETTIDLAPILITQQLMAAQIHATLALAAATAQNGIDLMYEPDFKAWDRVCGVPAEDDDNA